MISTKQVADNEMMNVISEDHDFWASKRKESALNYRDAIRSGNKADIIVAKQKLELATDGMNGSREEMKNLISSVDASAKTKDSDYVFLTFILNYLPHGLIGLLLAVIFSAAMSSTSGELNALAATTTVDFYKLLVQKKTFGKKGFDCFKNINRCMGNARNSFCFSGAII